MGIESATLAKLNLVTQGVSAVAGAYGAHMQSAGERQALQAQAQVQANNAQYARWQAEDAQRRGEHELARHQVNVAKLKGSQRASMAARGLDLGEGSPLDILSDTDYMAGIDSDTIKDNAAKEAWALRQQAAGLDANATILRQSAKGMSPLRSGFTSLLSGAGGVAKEWYRLRERGVL